MTEAANKNRQLLLLIAGLPLIMVLLASWLWFYVASGDIDLVAWLGTANKGELLSPALPLKDLQLTDHAGQPVYPFVGAPRWRILIPGAGVCDEDCGQLLYYTGQIHTAMGKYATRIERVYLITGGDAGEMFSQPVLQQHPDLKVLYTSAPAWSGLVAGALGADTRAAYFLVDPRGWIMMYYKSETDGKDVMVDLKFLLKNSRG